MSKGKETRRSEANKGKGRKQEEREGDKRKEKETRGKGVGQEEREGNQRKGKDTMGREGQKRKGKMP